MPRKTLFPRLRRKGKAFYYDTQERPRRWIPLGSHRQTALQKYERMLAKAQATWTVRAMVADYLEYLAAGGSGPRGKPVGESSLKQYHEWAKHIGAVFGHMRPEDLVQADVSLYLYQCKRASARQEVSVLSGAYSRAMLLQKATHNPCTGAKAMKLPAKRDGVPTLDNLRAVYANAKPLLRVAIVLAMMTAIRVSDLRLVRFDQLQASDIIEHQKTKAKQRFRLTPDLAELLEEARALHGKVRSLYVFARPDGQPYSANTITQWWRDACKAAGVSGFVWHDLRAFAATDAEHQGRDPVKLLAHSDPRTTAVYLRGKRVIDLDPLPRKLRM